MTKASHMALWVRTALRLRLNRVARVAMHRALKRSGAYRKRVPIGRAVDRPMIARTTADASVSGEAVRPKITLFGSVEVPYERIPDWLAHARSGVRHPDATNHWSRIPDFNPEFGDIKMVWELSRMQWLVDLARHARDGEDPRFTALADAWLRDWNQSNPPNQGPNWMCGQETALRILHAWVAFQVAGDRWAAGDGLAPWLENHLTRIQVSHGYAVGQANNHWTSEAAGMFVGAAWLARIDGTSARRKCWERRGRRSLEHSVRTLIEDDGSFAQYSTNYHRVALDTLVVAEMARRAIDAPPFSEGFYRKAKAATDWLDAMTAPDTGRAPLFGSHDGALLFKLDDLDVNDFRPTLQAASLTFRDRMALSAGAWDAKAAALGLLPAGGRDRSSRVGAHDGNPDLARKPVSQRFGAGGYVLLRNLESEPLRAWIRVPSYRFRPVQSDALHMDVWIGGENVLPDAGSLSYAQATTLRARFDGPAGHNTVQFDDREQMPRLGRFLYGAWLELERGTEMFQVDREGSRWSGAYVDSWGARHQRSAHLADGALVVEDNVNGFREQAILRWRAARPLQKIDGFRFVTGGLELEVDAPGAHVRVAEGWMSRTYGQADRIDVLEVTVPPGERTIVTRMRLVGDSAGTSA